MSVVGNWNGVDGPFRSLWLQSPGMQEGQVASCASYQHPKDKTGRGFALYFSDEQLYYMTTQGNKLVIPKYGTGTEIFFLAYNSFQ